MKKNIIGDNDEKGKLPTATTGREHARTELYFPNKNGISANGYPIWMFRRD